MISCDRRIARRDQNRYNGIIQKERRHISMDLNVEIRLGDVVQTRKQHPCGSSEWTVIRTGADIKIKCSGCGRIVMMDRETFLKRRKKLVSQGPEPV